MTDTAVQPAAAAVDQWLASFEEALTAGDTAAASELFLEDSYWRDLVSFTWNLKTVEGPAGVKDLLDNTLATTKPRNFATTEPAGEADDEAGGNRLRDRLGERLRRRGAVRHVGGHRAADSTPPTTGSTASAASAGSRPRSAPAGPTPRSARSATPASAPRRRR